MCGGNNQKKVSTYHFLYRFFRSLSISIGGLTFPLSFLFFLSFLANTRMYMLTHHTTYTRAPIHTYLLTSCLVSGDGWGVWHGHPLLWALHIHHDERAIPPWKWTNVGNRLRFSSASDSDSDALLIFTIDAPTFSRICTEGILRAPFLI